MATTVRCTWFFEGFQFNQGRGQNVFYGWTENWYLSAAVDQPLDFFLKIAASQAMGSWIQLRTGFLHRMYSLTAVRVVDVNNPRSTKTVFVNIAGRSGQKLADVDPHVVDPRDPAQVTCALLVDFTKLPAGIDVNAHHKRMLFRGLSLGAIVGNTLSNNAVYIDPILQFMNYVGSIETQRLVGAGVIRPLVKPIYLMRFRDPAAPPFTPVASISNPVGFSSRQIQIDCPLGVLAFGKKVRIKGVIEPRGANRVWTVMAESNTPYRLGTARKEVSGTYSGNGSAAVVAYDYGPADQYNIVGMRSRRTGRPFSRTRGRSSFRG